MITTLCLLILIYSILKRPVGWLIKKLEGVDWKGLAQDAWDKIVLYSKKAGRASTRVVLKFYYAMQDGELSTVEKALVYAGIIYIAVPGELLPSLVSLMTWPSQHGSTKRLGITLRGDNITPAIERKVEETLDNWFGPEKVTELIADFGEA